MYASALGKVLYTFCKVRGSKVISRFLDSQPRYLESALRAIDATNSLAAIAGRQVEDHPQIAQDTPGWEQEYFLLVWLGHLILTPFDLSLASSGLSPGDGIMGFVFRDSVPNIAYDSLNAALHAVCSPSLKQNAAAVLLVRLALRPDMRELGVLDSLISWCLSNLSAVEESPDIHSYTGILSTIDGVVRSANLRNIAQYVIAIFNTVTRLFRPDEAACEVIRSSAVAKKLAVKIQRHLLVQLLQVKEEAEMSSLMIRRKMLDEMGVLEDIIDNSLTFLADRDTQVRFAASKSLSMITLRLESDMADELVAAVLRSLNDDVLMIQHVKSLEAVDSTRWHGLTLTLSHLLFRRSPSLNRLPEIIEGLYLALTFEQRSSTGNSIGGNVRDAANFGLWSMARRYSTAELQKCEISSIKVGDSGAENLSALQLSANALVNAACLDPSGNVRRGSSAALQELVGRHPDRVESGIALVQAVDYHAVGLRRRAMSEVSVVVANLGEVYLDTLMQGLNGWRGVSAQDLASRNCAAAAIGRLTTLQTRQHRNMTISKIARRLKSTPTHEIEERHGLMVALTAIFNETVNNGVINDALEKSEFLEDLQSITSFWNVFDETLRITRKDMTASQRPELSASGIIGLVAGLSKCSLHSGKLAEELAKQTESIPKPGATALEVFTICLKGYKDQRLHEVNVACDCLCQLVGCDGCEDLARLWLRVSLVLDNAH